MPARADRGDNQRDRTLFATANALAVTALDVTTARRLGA